MFTDIIELREFYQSPRGRAAAGQLGRVLQRHIPAPGNGMLAAYGYAPHTLLPHLPNVMMMPAPQGVSAWPTRDANRAVLVDEFTWPLRDEQCDTVVLMHALECCGNPAQLLREAWRVLKGHGRLILVVPNRRGLWARAETTPFGRGQPFTAMQLRMLLRQTQFVAEQWERTLFIPPFKSGTLLATLPLWEMAGRSLLPNFGGLLVMSAAKQLYAPTGRAQEAPGSFALTPPLLRPAGTPQGA